jgi:hypothetical protein
MLLYHAGSCLGVSEVGDWNQMRIFQTIADKRHTFQKRFDDAIKERGRFS